MKASFSSAENKKKFFEIASHILKNLGLFQGADAWAPFKKRSQIAWSASRIKKKNVKITTHIFSFLGLFQGTDAVNTVYTYLEFVAKVFFTFPQTLFL